MAKETRKYWQMRRDQRCSNPQWQAMTILQANKGHWVSPSAHPDVPWQSFFAVIRKFGGEWRYGTRRQPAKCRTTE